uniref:Beta-amylase n=1 Tax=Entamoeba invadens TaxID=33085 RepID=S0B352_ENTIV|nr:beta-amylase precursor, putative [Entamoeba invadens]
MLFFFILTAFAVEVNLMLPLDTVNSNGLANQGQLTNDFSKIKSGGVVGVMSDIWWGLVETSPKTYNWNAYKTMVQLAKNAGLKFQAVMSFHKCGGNVGDTCDIPIPSWAITAGQNAGAFFKDHEGWVNTEYISFGADSEAVFEGRTPLQIYKDFMASFKSNFQSFIDDGTINEIQVGMGPCGETRYPSYPGAKFQYCGIGEFECSDKYSLAKLQAAATAAGHSEWGSASPSNAGTYNSRPPSSTGFFGSGSDNYASAYGKFFMDFYSNMLLEHTKNVLSSAKDVFGSLAIAGEISGIHWWWKDNSHAAELTAGYYNANGNNAYLTIANAFKPYGARFDFTCLEMSGEDSNCGSAPAALVDQAYKGAQSAGVARCGENALELCGYGGCDTSGFNQIVTQAKWYGLTAFTYLRMTRALLDDGTAWGQFKSFVNNMK